MEAEISGKINNFYGPGALEMYGVGQRSSEWDLNDWSWDGDLFVATPVNAVSSDCRTYKQLFPVPTVGGLSNTLSSSSGESDPGCSGKRKGDLLEKGRREMVVVVDDEDEPDDPACSLTLKLGGHVYPILKHVDLASRDEKNGKRSKVQVGHSNRAECQVEGCATDLRDSKDYHRRHKVCEMHAKASVALLGNVMQRFCQQCSRFHLLQEFDEGKRSCRRRLAGHNRRRRKTRPETLTNVANLRDDHGNSYLLTSLLRVLANLQSDSSQKLKDQELLSCLLKNLASLAGSFDERSAYGVQASQDLQKLGTSAGTFSVKASALTSNSVAAENPSNLVCSSKKTNHITEIHCSAMSPADNTVSVAIPSVQMPWKGNITEIPLCEHLQAVACRQLKSLVPVQDDVPSNSGFSLAQQVLPTGSMVERVRFRNFDLNNVCGDVCNGTEGPENSFAPGSQEHASLYGPSWLLSDSHGASPSQKSRGSDSAQSQSNTRGDAQNRTDRVVFKLFGKDPSDFPLVLRAQILDWLSNSPTDIEGYIRPGCIILTVYLRLAECRWEEICHNLRSSLQRLLDVVGDDFWKSGWVYARIQHQIAFIYDGQVVLDTPLLLNSNSHCQILSVTPIAASASDKVNFTVKVLNLAQSSIRLLCAFEGKYLVQETTQALVNNFSTTNEHDGVQYLSFSCSIPNARGRGFIEVEDHALSGSFFPFIVAEEDVCSEICMLESTINSTSDGICHDRMAHEKARRQALDFLHEIGWFLRRSNLKSSYKYLRTHVNLFPPTRFRWLIEFSIDRNWCAVVKKLLDVLFSGTVDVDGQSAELALSEMALLHYAVQRNQRSIVELLLRYVPSDDLESKFSKTAELKPCQRNFMFRPDMLGPFNVTPLHVAASRADAENVLEALTEDPGQVGIKAWKCSRDSSGFTPQDYACTRGFNSYIHLVQTKINTKSGAEHAVVDIPGLSADALITQKQSSAPSSTGAAGFQVDQRKSRLMQQLSCRLCSARQPAYGIGNGNLAYRPTMLFMVGIAAVCVCVGILLHSPPEVFSVFPPFRWELLDYGFI